MHRPLRPRTAGDAFQAAGGPARALAGLRHVTPRLLLPGPRLRPRPGQDSWLGHARQTVPGYEWPGLTGSAPETHGLSHPRRTAQQGSRSHLGRVVADGADAAAAAASALRARRAGLAAGRHAAVFRGRRVLHQVRVVHGLCNQMGLG